MLSCCGFFTRSQAADKVETESLSHHSPQCTTAKKTVVIAIGTILALGGVFFLLASLQVIPAGLNTVSSWGVWGKVGASLLIAGGILTIVIRAIKNRNATAVVMDNKARQLVNSKIANGSYVDGLQPKFLEAQVQFTGQDGLVAYCKQYITPKALELLQDIGLSNPTIEFSLGLPEPFVSVETDPAPGASCSCGLYAIITSDTYHQQIRVIDTIEYNASCGKWGKMISHIDHSKPFYQREIDASAHSIMDKLISSLVG